MQSKTVLVTGGTGFTGSHLVNRLIDEGYQVRVVDNQPGLFHDELKARGADITIGSVTDRDLMLKLCAGVDTVHHVAAAFRVINLPQSVYYDVNVNGTRYLLEAAQQHNVRKFVYCSTCGVHGNVENPPAAETAPITPADYYQQSKWEGEQVAHEFMAQGMDITILRPAAIYGPGDPERWAMLFQRSKNGRFLMFGDGEVTYHPLYVANLVDAFMLAMCQPAAKGQTYLIADDRYLTLNEIVQTIGKVLNRDIQIVHLPFAPLWLAAVACEIVYAPLKKAPPLFRRRVDWFRQNRAFDIGKAKRELGYAPKVDLYEGLSKTAVWYREHGYL